MASSAGRRAGRATPSSATASSAPATISPGARSPPIASIATVQRHRPSLERSARVSRPRRPGGPGTSRSCRTPCAGASPRRSWGTASAPGPRAASSTHGGCGSWPGGSCAWGRPLRRSSGSRSQCRASRQSVPARIGRVEVAARTSRALRSVPQTGHRPRAVVAAVGRERAARAARRRARAARGRSRRPRAGRSRPRSGRLEQLARRRSRARRQSGAGSGCTRARTRPGPRSRGRRCRRAPARATASTTIGGRSTGRGAADAAELVERRHLDAHVAARRRVVQEIGDVEAECGHVHAVLSAGCTSEVQSRDPAGGLARPPTGILAGQGPFPVPG